MLDLRCFLFVVVLCCSAAALKKCCPDDEGVLIARVNGSGSHNFKCIKALDSYDTAVNKTLHPLRVGKKDLNFSYGFPDGCQYSMHSYKSKEKIPSEHCIDKIFADELLNGTLVIAKGNVKVFGCDVGRIQRPSLTTIAKCCLGNMVYDTEHHLCINRHVSDINGTIRLSSNEGLFERFIEGESDLLDIKYGPPYCPPSKAMYSYVHTFYDIEMTDDMLILNRSSHGENFVLKPGTFCADETHDGVLVVRGCRDPYEGTPRVFKCCPEGYIYGFKELNCKGTPTCVPNTDWGVTFDFYDLSNMENVTRVSQPDVMGISYTLNCSKRFQLRNDHSEEFHYLNKENGNIVAPKYKERHPMYCMDTYKPNCGDQKSVSLTLSCFPDLVNIQKIRAKLLVYSVGLAISSIFLAVTLLVYIALPPLRNLHGKTIMCHVASMLVAFSCLARVQWAFVEKGYCIVLGYIIYFSFLAAFSWLNVMCFDIWWTFANIRTMQTIRQDKDFMRFLRYSLYAWGVPIVLTITALLLDIYDVAPTWLDPNFGEPQCWINTSSHKAPVLILFTLPIGLQIVANLVFFILTAIYCNKVKSEIHRMQAGSMGERCRKRFSADKAKYTMNLKLFIVMGISWILEIISTLVAEPIELWYAADAINVLQGIPIFCILVLKRKIFHLMKRRLGFDNIQLRPRSDITMTTGISSTSSEGRKSLPWRKSETGLNGLLTTKASENGKSP